MIAWIITVLSLVTYLAIGQVLAKLHAPRAWRTARKVYSSQDNIRESAQQQTMSMMFLWPVYQMVLIIIAVAMAGFGIVDSRTSHIINPHDPEVLRERQKELERVRRIQELEYRSRINRLERETGMALTEWE